MKIVLDRRIITFSFLLISLVVLVQFQVKAQSYYVLAKAQPATQAKADIENLKKLIGKSCDENDFHQRLETRNEILKHSSTYLREFPALQLALIETDTEIMDCAVKLMHSADSVITADLAIMDKQNLNMSDYKLITNNYKRLISNFNDAQAILKDLQNKVGQCESDLVHAKDKEERYSVLFYSAMGIGGPTILVLIIVLLKLNAAKDALKKEAMKIFEDTIDSIREKLIDLLLGEDDDEKWKEKFEKIQELFRRYQRNEVRAAEFKKELSSLLSA